MPLLLANIITPEGFVRPSLQEIIQTIKDDIHAEVDPGLDLSEETTLGQVIAIEARQRSLDYEVLEVLASSNDPDKAVGDQLTALAKLTGTARRPASFSTVVATVNLDSGTELVAGDHFAAVSGKTDVRFTPAEDFTAPSTGDFDLVFRAENTGPILVTGATLTVIATSVVGWNSVINSEDAVPGRLADNDPTLRLRREQDITRAGSSTVDAIKTDILASGQDPEHPEWALLPAITHCVVYENASNVFAGRPPHCFEAVFYDATINDYPLDPDDQTTDEKAQLARIAQVIWQSKPAGIRSYGAVGLYGVAKDKNGDLQNVAFTNAADFQFTLAWNLTVDPDVFLTPNFRQAIVQRCNQMFGIADDVAFSAIFALPYVLAAEGDTRVAGIININSLTVNGASSGIIAVGERQIARFQGGNLSVVTS